MVHPPDVLDHPIGAPAGQVATAVQPRPAVAERVGNEARGAEPGALEVATRQALAADVQLADTAGSHRVEVAVEHVQALVRDRHANRARRALRQVSQRQWTVGHVHRGFGDAVHVDQLRRTIAEALEPRAQAADLQRLAAKYHVAQLLVAALAFGTGHLHQLAERRRRLVEHGHPLLAQQLVEGLRRTADILRHDHQAATMQQGAEQLPYREVEGIGVEQRPAVLPAEAEPAVRGLEQAQHVAVRQQGALRLAGGAGGVDDIGQVIQAHRDVRVDLGQACVVGVVGGQVQHLHVRRQAQPKVALAEQQLQAAVLDHVVQALQRVGRVQRHVGATGLEDGQQADHHFQRTRCGQAYQHVRADASGDQRMGDLVGPAVQLGIAQLFAFADQRRRLRRAGRLGFDQAMQRLARREGGRGTIPGR